MLVCGSRNWDNPLAILSELTKVAIEHAPFVLIEGCAAGADHMAETIAGATGWPVEHYPADWKRHGRAAGPIRNRWMLTEGRPDLVLAFQKNKSRGTQHMIDIAREAGVEVRVFGR